MTYLDLIASCESFHYLLADVQLEKRKKRKTFFFGQFGQFQSSNCIGRNSKLRSTIERGKRQEGIPFGLTLAQMVLCDVQKKSWMSRNIQNLYHILCFPFLYFNFNAFNALMQYVNILSLVPGSSTHEDKRE